MGKLKEQYYTPEYKEDWFEVEAAALLGLPVRHQLEQSTLQTVAALPPGTAISAEISITADGAVNVMLRQLGFGSDEDDFPAYLALIAPTLAPGARILVGAPSRHFPARQGIVPDWLGLPERQRHPQPANRCGHAQLRLPKPPATWPWDLKRALASIAAGGGGSLILTARHFKRTARLVRRISEQLEELVAAGYALPDERQVINGQINCRGMIDDPALLGFEVEIAAETLAGPLPSLVSIALFGTLPGPTSDLDGGEEDLRLLAGSRHAPGCLLPSVEDASSLLGTRALRNDATDRPWIIGTTGGGIPVSLSDTDRSRHLYVIGATGTGKSTLLRSLILQDAQAGEGIILLDPHGDLAEEVAAVIPAERAEDIVYADAADPEGLFAVSLLPDTADSAAFEIAADMLVNIFKEDLYSEVKEAFGPMFESYFRNALGLLLAADPSERYLANFPRVFEDREFRNRLLENCINHDLVSFWKKTALRTSGEAELTNITPYITGKLTRFIATRNARSMFPAAKRCLDFSAAMDEGKILILRCPKGALGEGLAELAMSTCLMKIRSAAMARAGTHSRRPVRVYIDEFQACKGNSLQTLLAEGRKFGVSLVLANQSLGQIGGTSNRSVGSATLANVGNLVSFRLGATDAALLSPWLDMPDRWRELCWLPDFTINARLLDKGRPTSFHALRSPDPEVGTSEMNVMNPNQILDRTAELALDCNLGLILEGGI